MFFADAAAVAVGRLFAFQYLSNGDAASRLLSLSPAPLVDC